MIDLLAVLPAKSVTVLVMVFSPSWLRVTVSEKLCPSIVPCRVMELVSTVAPSSGEVITMAGVTKIEITERAVEPLKEIMANQKASGVRLFIDGFG